MDELYWTRSLDVQLLTFSVIITTLITRREPLFTLLEHMRLLSGSCCTILLWFFIKHCLSFDSFFFWPFFCLSLSNLCFMINSFCYIQTFLKLYVFDTIFTLIVSFEHCIVVLSFHLQVLITHFGIFKHFLNRGGQFKWGCLLDTKGIIRIRKSKNDRQHNGKMKKGQKDRQWSTKDYTENKRSSNTSFSNTTAISQWSVSKGNNKITELRTILQRESQNS